MSLSQQYLNKLYEEAQLCDDEEKLERYHRIFERQQLKQQGKENRAE